MENKIKTSRLNRMITFAICSNSNNDVTWFIVENDKLVPSEPCDHSIGTTSDSFFCSNSNSDVKLRMTS